MRAIVRVIISPPLPNGIAWDSLRDSLSVFGAGRDTMRPLQVDSPAASCFRSGAHAVIRSRWNSPVPDRSWRSCLRRIFVAWLGSAADDGGKPGNAEPTRSGRTPWTTSRVVGSPDPPPPFKVVRAFPNLKFDHPLLIARYPGGNRLIVGEQSGVLYSFADDPDARADLFLDLPRETQDDSPARGGEGGRGGVRAGLPPGLRAEPPVLRLLYPARLGPPPAESRGRHARVPVPGHPDGPAADRPVERGDRPLLPARRPQRRGPPLRPRRHALHLHGRRGEPEPARPVQHGAGHLRPALVHPADRRGPEGRGEELRHPQGQPLRRA